MVDEQVVDQEKLETEVVDTAAAEGSENDFTGEAAESDGMDGDEKESKSANDLEAIYDVPVKLQAVLGHSNMKVSQMLKLGRGAVVELDKKVGEAIDIYVNNRLVARGEIVIVEDKLGVTMTEIIKANIT